MFVSHLYDSGTVEECRMSQKALEKGKTAKEKQWSSAETELSSNEDTEGDEENVRLSHLTMSKKTSNIALSF